MAVSVRSLTTAATAVAAASAIAVVPSGQAMIAATTPAQSVSIQLAASASNIGADPVDPFAVNPLTAWLDVFETTGANVASLVDEMNPPAVVLQQVAANWFGYFVDLPDISKISDGIQANAKAASDAIFAENDDTVTDPDHVLLLIAAGGVVPEQYKPVLEYLTTYSSGIVWGMVGTVLSPILAMAAAGSDLWGYLVGEGADWAKALNVLINIPAIAVDAFLNGYGEIDLTSTVSGLIPEPIVLTNFGLTLGGLLSPAGTMFNALTAELSDVPIVGDINAPGAKAGPLASWFAQGKVQAKAIGWSGEGWPLFPAPPAPPSEEPTEEPTDAEAEAEETAPGEEGAVEEPLVDEGTGDETPVEEGSEEETLPGDEGEGVLPPAEEPTADELENPGGGVLPPAEDPTADELAEQATGDSDDSDSADQGADADSGDSGSDDSGDAAA